MRPKIVPKIMFASTRGNEEWKEWKKRDENKWEHSFQTASNSKSDEINQKDRFHLHFLLLFSFTLMLQLFFYIFLISLTDSLADFFLFWWCLFNRRQVRLSIGCRLYDFWDLISDFMMMMRDDLWWNNMHAHWYFYSLWCNLFSFSGILSFII